MPFRRGLVKEGRGKRCHFGDGLTSPSVTVLLDFRDRGKFIWGPSSLSCRGVTARWLLLRSIGVSYCVACSQICWFVCRGRNDGSTAPN
jgi:hypothetical protein